MKLTPATLKLLQNFATINPNIVVGANEKLLKTVSEAKNIMANAVIDEDFAATFGIYDLNEFLSAMRLIDDPAVTVDSTLIEVQSADGRSGLDYFCSSPEILTSPKKDIKDPAYEVTVSLTEDQLAAIKKAAGVLRCETVAFCHVAGDDTVWARVSDSSNKSSNVFKIALDALDSIAELPEFNFDIRIENLKIISDDYNVSFSSKRISRWAANATEVTYWIALETTSAYSL